MKIKVTQHTFNSSTYLKNSVENHAMIDLDEELADIDLRQNLVVNVDALCIGQHGVVRASNVKLAVALVELAQAAARDARVVAPVNLCFANVLLQG